MNVTRESPAEPSPCAEMRALVLWSADDEIDRRQMEILDRHIVACSDCGAYREALHRIDGMLSQYGSTLFTRNPPQVAKQQFVEVLGVPDKRRWLWPRLTWLCAFAVHPSVYGPVAFATMVLLVLSVSRVDRSVPQSMSRVKEVALPESLSEAGLATDSAAQELEEQHGAPARGRRRRFHSRPERGSSLPSSVFPSEGTEVIRFKLSMVGGELDPFLEDGLDSAVIFADLMFGQDGLPHDVHVVR